MTQIILQPVANSKSLQRFYDSVLNPVDLFFMLRFVEDSYSVTHLSQLYPSGKVPAWGVRAGRNYVNVGKWRRIKARDIVLFTGRGKVFASAIVTFKTHNRDLALE